MTPQIRFWLYAVLTAAVPLLIIYGILDSTTAPLWVALGAAALGTSTAAMNTPPGRHRAPE